MEHNLKTALFVIALFFAITLPAIAQRFPIPGSGGQSNSTLIDTINHARDAYQIELLTISTYEAALKTTYLKDEIRSRAEHSYEEHKKHGQMLLDLLDHLGGKSEDIKPIKKNYEWMDSEQQILDRLIKADRPAKKSFLATQRKPKTRRHAKSLKSYATTKRLT